MAEPSPDRVHRRMVARYVRSADRVLEGGAGIGSVTRVLLDGGAHVTAYEPGAEPFAVLEQFVGVYPHFTPVKAALSHGPSAIPYHVYEPWFSSRTTALGGLTPARTILVPAHAWSTLLTQPWDGLMLNAEGMEHALLAEVFAGLSDLRWIVAELHGPPELLARTIAQAPPRYRLEAIEPCNESHLVCGWVRTEGP